MPAIRRVEFDFDFPPGHVAAYLVDGPEPILVDAGLSGDGSERDLRAGLSAHGLDLADIDHLLFTHFHTDHVGQAGTLRDVADPTVHAPTTFRPRMGRAVSDVRRLASETMRDAGLSADRIETALSDVLPQHEAMQAALPVDAVDHWIEPGSTTEIGGVPMDVLATPGHDKTHVSYGLDADDHLGLISGDMAIEPFRTWIVRSGWVDGFADDVAAFRSALDRLAATDADRVYPGHGPVHDALAATVERDRSSLADRLETCLAALPAEGATAAEVAEATGSDRVDLFRLLPEVVAALEALESGDGVRSRTVDGARRFYRAE
jgi:glyoxylase-like metal-dependent hydrolase (beta-lactamase superfamily II)